MHCLGLGHTGYLFCVVFLAHLRLARLEAMRKWVGQAGVQAEDAGVVRQRVVSPSTGPSTPTRKCGWSHRPAAASPERGQESDCWNHLEWRAHALCQEVDSFNSDDSCSLLASDRLFLGHDAGTVPHRERG